MKKQAFLEKWKVEKGVKDPFDAMMTKEEGKEVTLPHDAMISEDRTEDCENQNQTGYYPCYSYTYRKTFQAPKEWEEMQVQLEFEGVMKKAMVYINEEPAACHAYGYSQFFVDMKPYLHYGRENQIKVIAVNENKSSRWYPGSGIYRDVNLYTGGQVCILPEGMRITTEDLEEDYAVLSVDTRLKGIHTGRKEVTLEITIADQKGNIVAKGNNTVTVPGEREVSTHMRLVAKRPELWSVDHPALYTCRAAVKEKDRCLDMAEETFGIRRLQLDAVKGLRINGKSVKLQGACIHHDNGIIGACTLERAEEYRIRKLKEAGFNSIRSAHNPMSKAMLRACDRIGILVMDELSDMWNTPKNSHDFAADFGYCWKDEARRMVAKDYNHPCVIMYSVGNELPEIGNIGGRIQNREIANLLRKEDSTRFVTCGINGMLAMSSMSAEEGDALAKEFMPEGMKEETSGLEGNNVSEEPVEPERTKDREDTMESEKTQPDKQAEAPEGSERLNDVMGDIPYQVRDMLNTLPATSRALKEVCDEMDVIGLNYMPSRHVLEHELNPNHVVVGAESYPTEIAHLWKIVEEHPFVIGDFTWTGYDYLGEAGIGGFHYDAMPKGQGIYPDRLAYCGDINLNGYRRPVSYLREIAYGLRKEPFISVERVNRYGYGCVRNHWKYDDAIDSWTYPGYEGKPARLKVLSPSEEVELFRNGTSLGRKKSGWEHEFTASYELLYEPGELTAVAYDQGEESGRMTLETAGKVSGLDVTANTDTLKADSQDALILDISLIDDKGIPNMWEVKTLKISVEGPAYLAGFGNADPASERSYQQDTCETFDGRAMAVIRTRGEKGEVVITLETDGIETQRYSFPVCACK